MSLEEMRRLTRAERFVPFHIVLADGRRFDIPQPRFVMPLRDSALISECGPLIDNVERIETVAMHEIVALEPLD